MTQQPTTDQQKATEPITIFFSSDEAYAPYLSVALVSIVSHADSKRRYRIIVLSRGITDESRSKLLQVTAPYPNVELDFHEMDERFIDVVKDDKNELREGEITLTIYFRLFIARMYPQIDRALYLDCDTIVERDVADLYDTDLQGKALGAINDTFVATYPVLRRYAERMLGIPAEEYYNSGVLVMDLDQWRELDVTARFAQLIGKYHVRSVAVDQDYMNVMFEGRILRIDPRWDVMTASGKKPTVEPWLVHYNLISKPWFHPHGMLADHFWNYAPRSPFYEQLEAIRDASPDDMSIDDRKKGKIISDAEKFLELPVTFRSLKEKGVQVRL